VLVIEDGQIVEDGSPQSLMADGESRYSALNAANAAMNQEIWGSEQWRRIQVEAGRVQEL